MNKLVYIIAQGHTGSTLLDCILGTHPEVVSSGEMCYLNYQIERSQNKIATVEKQDICTCLENFSDCKFWNAVADDLNEKKGINILKEPKSYDRAFFGLYSYRERGNHIRSESDKNKEEKVKKILLKNCSKEEVLHIEPKIQTWVTNERELCESMAKVVNKKVVIDSSKNITKALLMHKFYPNDVSLIFIHRNIRGLATSIKRLRKKRGRVYLALLYAMLAKFKYEKKISRLKTIDTLKGINVHYEEFVESPNKFLIQFSEKLELSKNGLLQTDDNFFIEPNKLHIVAGNPMRYRGRQQVIYDNRWGSELNKFELFILKLFEKVLK